MCFTQHNFPSKQRRGSRSYYRLVGSCSVEKLQHCSAGNALVFQNYEKTLKRKRRFKTDGNKGLVRREGCRNIARDAKAFLKLGLAREVKEYEKSFFKYTSEKGKSRGKVDPLMSDMGEMVTGVQRWQSCSMSQSLLLGPATRKLSLWRQGSRAGGKGTLQ